MSTAPVATGIGRLRQPRAWLGGVPALVAAGAVGLVALDGAGGPALVAGEAIAGPAVVTDPAVGPLVLGAAGLVLLGWLVAGQIGAFAAGQIAVAAVAGTAHLESVVLAQAGLAACLFGPAVHTRHSIRHAVATVVAVGAVAAVAAGVWLASGMVWLTAAAIAAVTAVAAYLLHRWSLLALGVLGDG